MLSELASAILPFEPRVATDEGIALHYAVSAGLMIALWLGLPRPARSALPAIDSRVEAARFMRWLEFVSILGLALLLFNVIFIQGIPYSGGIAAARESMRALREARDGSYSALSFIGNLLAAGSFLSIGAGVVLLDRVPSFAATFIRQWGVVVCLSLLTGGREPLWIALGMTFAGSALRVASGRMAVARPLIRPLATYVLVAGALAVLIAQVRIDGYQGAFDIIGYCGHLGGVPRDGADTTVPLPGAAAPVAAYFAHTRWLSIETFSNSGAGGISTLRVALNTLSRSEAMSVLAPGTVSFEGRWIPAAASAWYDLRWAGVAVLIAATFVIARWFGRARDVVVRTGSPLAAAFGALLGCLCFTAPMQFAFESIHFLYAAVLLVAALVLRGIGRIGSRSSAAPRAVVGGS